MINTILFDLDGTLLSIDATQFEKIYFGGLSSHFSDMYPPDQFIKLIWGATKAMVMDTTDRTNEVVFMEALGSVVQDKLPEMQQRFQRFYESDFDRIQTAVTIREEILKAVDLLKQKGYTLVIATNPMFPKIAIEKRIRWTGLNRADFVYVTSFEKNHYCKPQPQFFKEILTDLNKTAAECMMVGNDAQEDMVAETLGIQTYLLTTHLAEGKAPSFTAHYQGDYEDFYHFVQQLPTVN